MSYLAGPLTRDQIRALSANRPAVATPQTVAAAAPVAIMPAIEPAPTPAPPANTQPMLPQEIKQFFLPIKQALAGNEALEYQPALLGAADITYSNARYGVQTQKRGVWSCGFTSGTIPVDWAQAQEVGLGPDELDSSGFEGASFGALPADASNPKRYTEWSKQFTRWLQTSQALSLYRSANTKLVSQVDESERDFRIRLQQAVREDRDAKIDALRKRYTPKTAALEEKLRKTEQKMEREQSEVGKRRMDAALSLGGGLLGAFFGGRKSGVRTAMRDIGRMAGGGDVGDAQEDITVLTQQRADLEAQLQAEIAALESGVDAQTEQLETVSVTPKAADVHVHFVGLGWEPRV